MQVTSQQFKTKAKAAIADPQLQSALQKMQVGAVGRRAEAVQDLPEFEALRDKGKQIKDHTLAHLDYYLTEYEKKVIASGGKVHWASTPAEAKQIVLDICASEKKALITKGKSMLTEEIALNDFLIEHDFKVVETDLGEYILQIRGEHPTHIVTPAIHVNQQQVSEDFYKTHTHLDPKRDLGPAENILDEARQILREQFIKADVGITGANFLLAESGSSIIVTNEGNGDLTQTLAKKHIVMAGIDKVVPSFADAGVLIRLLGRSATGQEMTTYTTVSTGPRQAEDLDGPEEYHVILVDNGRSALLGTEFQPMLRCIRCAACMNHCPVYQAVGGKTYGWVYPGPMGSVLTPAIVGLEKTASLPNASTFCGKCAEVCPVKIPLPDLMRYHRRDEFDRHLNAASTRWALKIWAWLACKPGLYHWIINKQIRLLYRLSHKHGFFKRLWFGNGWTQFRDFPAPQKGTFMQQYRQKKS
jgi:L-lactate dehydrogenase complex protein LldF